MWLKGKQQHMQHHQSTQWSLAHAWFQGKARNSSALLVEDKHLAPNICRKQIYGSCMVHHNHCNLYIYTVQCASIKRVPIQKLVHCAKQVVRFYFFISPHWQPRFRKIQIFETFVSWQLFQETGHWLRGLNLKRMQFFHVETIPQIHWHTSYGTSCSVGLYHSNSWSKFWYLFLQLQNCTALASRCFSNNKKVCSTLNQCLCTLSLLS